MCRPIASVGTNTLQCSHGTADAGQIVSDKAVDRRLIIPLAADFEAEFMNSSKA